MTDREKHLKVLEKMFYSMEKLESGVILPTSEVKTALAFAISSIKTDLKYDLLFEETTHIADADKKIESTTKNDLAVDVPDNNVGKIDRPSVIPQPCEDAVSRQAVLDLIADYDLSMGQVVKGIHALPSVTPRNQVYPLCEDCHTKMDEVRRAYDNAMKQESILGKLRAEIENINVWGMRYEPDTYLDKRPQIVQKVKEHVIEIIDKYKAEMEEV